MFKTLLLSSFLLLCSSSAFAYTIQFICNNEEITNEIAQLISDHPGEVVTPLVAPLLSTDNPPCIYLPFPLSMEITYKGMTFGESGVGEGVLQVVGFFDQSHQAIFYGIFPVDQILLENREKSI